MMGRISPTKSDGLLTGAWGRRSLEFGNQGRYRSWIPADYLVFPALLRLSPCSHPDHHSHCPQLHPFLLVSTTENGYFIYFED